MNIKIKLFDELCSPEQHGDLIDLKSAKDMNYAAGDTVMVPLGVAMQLPLGYEAHLYPRSSTLKHFGLIMTCSVGIIDEAYCGNNDQWHFPAYALRDGEVKKGERIAQFKIVRHQPSIHFEEVDFLENEDRGGFGSTGKR